MAHDHNIHALPAEIIRPEDALWTGSTDSGGECC